MKRVLVVAALLLVCIGGSASASSTGGLTQLPSPNDCIEGATGLGCGTTVSTGLASADSVATSPDGKNVYVASFASGAVTAFARASDGSLSSLGSVTAGSLRQATSVAVSPDGKTVYATGSGGNAVVWLTRSSTDGSLSFGGCISETGNSPCALGTGLGQASDVVVSPDGSHVYVSAFGGGGGYATGDVASFARAADGSLTEIGCIEEAGDTHECGTTGTGLTAANALAITPDGGNVYVVSDNDPGAVAAFSRDATSGVLTELGCVGKTGSSECSATASGIADLVNAAVSPDGNDLYVVSDVSAGVVGHFSIGSGGALTAQGCIASVASVCGTTVHGTADAFGVAVSPDGSMVYIASPGQSGVTDSAVSAFSRGSDGSLTQLASPDDCIESSGTSLCGRSGTGINDAMSVAVSPDGANAYVAARPSGGGTVAEFSIASAATTASLTVTSTSDGSGTCPSASSCTLRQALADIPAGGTITLPAGTYVLGSQLLILKNVTIAGAGAASTSIYQMGAQRVIEVGDDTSQGAPANVSATVTISGVTITHGNSTLGDGTYNGGVGGGIWIDSGSTVTLDQVAVTQNGAQVSGGGVDNDGATTITRSTITTNRATGASYEIGGGIDNWGTLTVTNTTIDGNSSGHEGGGIDNGGGATLTNVTISNNVAGTPGGGVYGTGSTSLVNTLLDSNTLVSGGALDCGSAVTSLGHNLATDTSCASSFTATGDLNNAASSAGIDAGDDASCPAVDENGTTRPQGPHCDIGALETTVASGGGGGGGGGTTTTSNTPPTPSFTASPSGLGVSVDASASSDPDGTIVSYAWDFGDGGTGSGVTASHTYAAAGTYTITLTVTDDGGASSNTTHTVNVAANQPPTASFTSSTVGLAASVDATGSSDSDGTIASYSWDFGDGGTAAGATATHTYASAGTYTVTLTVTDNGGATATATHSVSVAIANQPPQANFTAVPSSTPGSLAVAFDASSSIDLDGTVASYAWDYGDGTSGSGVSGTHTYASAGTYTITLTATDDQGATNTATHTVSVPRRPANQLPTASFTTSVGASSVAVDASASSDPDGTIASYAWDFGDGATGTGANAAHTYSASGTYTISLTVTDNDGGTAAVSHTVTVTVAPPTGGGGGGGSAPTASFAASTNGLAAQFDASASSDSDGTIAKYTWDFGDGGTGSGVNPTHTYPAAGAYTVTLTVQDNTELTGTVQHQVTVTTTAGGWTTAVTATHKASPAFLYNQQGTRMVVTPLYAVQLTATVTPKPDGGTVTFKFGNSTLCTSTVDANGTATCYQQILGGGTYTDTISYDGDASFAASSTTTDVLVQVPTATTLTLGPQTSTGPTYHAHVGPNGSDPATIWAATMGGTVAFSRGGSPIAGCESVPLNSTGDASCAAPAPKSGAAVTAAYSGTTGFAASSATQTYAASTVTVSAPAYTWYDRQTPFTATTSGAGTVAFTIDGTPVPGCETVTVDTSTDQAGCAYTWEGVSLFGGGISLNQGPHTLAATFTPSSGGTGSSASAVIIAENYTGSTSASVAIQGGDGALHPGAAITLAYTIQATSLNYPTAKPVTTVTLLYSAANGRNPLPGCSDLPLTFTLIQKNAPIQTINSDTGGTGPTVYPGIWQATGTCHTTVPRDASVEAFLLVPTGGGNYADGAGIFAYTPGGPGGKMPLNSGSVDYFFKDSLGTLALPLGAAAPQAVVLDAPPPHGVPLALLATPTSKTITGGSTAVLTASTPSAKATVTVPAHALPAGTTVSIYPVQQSTFTDLLVPARHAYLSAFAVSWQTTSGGSPKAATPLTMTIVDPTIKAGDTIYQATSKGVQAVGTATTNGKATITFSTDPMFIVAAAPAIALRRAGKSGVTIGCARGTCTGTVELLAGSRITARRSYALASGMHRTVVFHTTPRATTVRVTVVGGATRLMRLRAPRG